MFGNRVVILCVAIVLVTGCVQRESGNAGAAPSVLQQAIDGTHRSAANRARDIARKPAETLAFWGFRPDMTVVEVWPGGGWYTEVLAPALRDEGRLIAASFPESAKPPFRAAIGRDYLAKLAADPEVYGRVEVVPFDPPEYTVLAPAGTADMVILSRHFHNFIATGIVDEVLASAFEALRPGGVLAIVQHRALPDAVPEWEQRSGYVREQWLIEAVTSAGFVLQAVSSMHHNPRDGREHEDGVWSLPPSFRSCSRMEASTEKQACLDRFTAIGESDRMTLKFVKPD